MALVHLQIEKPKSAYSSIVRYRLLGAHLCLPVNALTGAQRAGGSMDLGGPANG